MKGAIASVELFAWEPRDSTGKTEAPSGHAAAAPSPRRLTWVIGAPTRRTDGDGWSCRVALADLKRPVEVIAADSVGALSAALACGEAWLEEMREAGIVFTRDREGSEPY